MDPEILKKELVKFLSYSHWKLPLPFILVLVSLSSILIFQAHAPLAEKNLERGAEIRKYVVAQDLLVQRFYETNQTGKFDKMQRILNDVPRDNQDTVILKGQPEIIFASLVAVSLKPVDPRYPAPCYMGLESNSDAFPGAGCSLYIEKQEAEELLHPDRNQLLSEFASENNLTVSESYLNRVKRTTFGTPRYLDPEFAESLEAAKPVDSKLILSHLTYLFIIGYLISSVLLYLEKGLQARPTSLLRSPEPGKRTMHPFSWLQWHGQSLFAKLFGKVFWAPPTAAVVIVRDGELLALHNGDFHLLPGGTLKRGERFEETAVREVREETGYGIEIEAPLKEDINPVGGPEIIFSAEILNPEIEPEGSWEGEPVWIPVEEAPGKNWRFHRDIDELLEKTG